MEAQAPKNIPDEDPSPRRHVPTSCPVFEVEASALFDPLGPEYRRYLFWWTRACWAGAQICYFQKSFEAPAIFYLF